MKRYLAVILALAALIFPKASAVLTANYLEVKLPFPSANQAPFYDGQDHIYLFGGSNNWDKILRFSIASETIEEVGILPDVAFKGSIQPDSRGNLFYFAGGTNSTQVYKYDANSQISSFVATLPYNTYGSKSFKHSDTSNIVYILGGSRMEEKILAFDMETYTSFVAATIPSDLLLRTIDRIGNKAYGFGFIDRRAFEWDLEKGLEMREVGPENSFFFSNNPASVKNGTLIYLVGGYTPITGDKTGNLIQFNAVTFESKFSPVSGLRLNETETHSVAPASVFVPKLNRIYCFGGESFTETFVRYDDIFYFDMTSDFLDFTSGASVSSSQFLWVLLVNLFIFSYQCF